MPSYQPEQIRNVVLLSHGGAGKTSIAEAILFDTGAINRLGRVDDGTTTSDWDPDEQKRKISTSTSLLPVEWKSIKINLLDAPGYADFVGEMKAAVRVADAAIIVVCGASGVEVGTELVWKYADELDLPRLVFINKMDRENADFFRVLEQMQQTFGAKCLALQVPIGAQASFKGTIDLIDQKAYLGTDGKEAAIPEELQTVVASHREKLIEAIAETDDDLLAKYLDGETLDQESLWKGLKTAVSQGKVVPVLAGSATQNVSILRLLDAIAAIAPSPADRGTVSAHNVQTDKDEELTADPQGPLAAFIFKSTADPYVGKLSYIRVFSGVLKSDSHVWNAARDKMERVGQLLLVRGKTQEPIQQVTAGDLGAVAKLAETFSGDTLTTREHPAVLAPVNFPPPLFSAAVHPKTKVDLDKLGHSLARLAEEDPTLHVDRDPDTAETILSGIGESHVEIAVEKMKRKFGVEVTIATPRVSYKETIAMPVKAEYKHKKQTGGHGQYGHVLLELEPLPRGTGFEFADKVVGGSVPRNYIPAVEKGVNSAIHEGVLARFPVVDLKVTLYDGSYHPVDSSDMAFQIAAAQAFKLGVQKGQPVLLEPIMTLRVTVPESLTGDIMSDLNTKRARVLGMTPENGASTIEAMVPLAEVQHYATDLRSLTQGRGTFSIEISHYEEVPSHITQKIVEQVKKEREAAEKAP